MSKHFYIGSSPLIFGYCLEFVVRLDRAMAITNVETCRPVDSTRASFHSNRKFRSKPSTYFNAQSRYHVFGGHLFPLFQQICIVENHSKDFPRTIVPTRISVSIRLHNSIICSFRDTHRQRVVVINFCK